MADNSTVTLLRAEIEAHLRANRPAEAEAAYLRLIAVAPQDAAAWLELGMLRWRTNQWATAEVAIRRAIEIAPDQAKYYSALGGLLLTQKRYREAAQSCREAVALNPIEAANWGMIGMALWSVGDLAGADEAYRQSLRIRPDDADLARNYARLLLQRFGPESSITAFEQTVGDATSAAGAWLAAGDAFLIAEMPQPALDAYQRAASLAPADKELHYRIAESLTRKGPPEAAEPLVRQLVATEPLSARARVLLATLRERQIKPAEAADVWRSLLLKSPNPEHHSRLLSLTQYGDGIGPGELLHYHRAWDQAYGEPLLPKVPLVVDANRKQRPLRLGFLSADFARHPVGHMVLPLLEHLDKSQCQITCYLVDRAEGIDDYTARFQRVADRWDHFRDSSDDVIAEVIRKDEIDILFDLLGHHGRRLGVFARKPAPIQVSWFGYVGTTGLGAMDYLLADRFHVAPGEEHFYRERILRMPHGYACYGPPTESPEVGPLPAASSGRFTFGSFNNPLKVTPGMVDLWARVLHSVEGSQLLLKFRGYEQEQLTDRLRVEFAQHGVPISRVLLEGCSSAPKVLMSAYNRVDLALDTLPYSGGLTTCEALWMGVPVIALSGKTFAGRHAVSHLSNAGLAQFVARDRADYVRLASEWATRRDDLARLRAGLRERVQASPLCDGPRFAADFLHLMRATWDASC